MNNYEIKYKNTCKFIKEIIKEYKDKTTKDELDTELYCLYLKSRDPDGQAKKEFNGIICKCDGLISMKRIITHEKIDDYVKVYEKYRKYPIIYFPEEDKGINQSRSKPGYISKGKRLGGFGDRIDHTLYDLKMYFEDPTKCRLINAYSNPKTKEWLDNSIKTFDNLITELGIKGIFTDNQGNIYDLETSDEFIIEAKDIYPYEWTENYYNNLKKKIDKYNENIEAQNN